MKKVFKKWRETLPYVLTSSQTIYLANLDGAADRVTSQSTMKEFIFVATTEKLTQKCLRMGKVVTKHWYQSNKRTRAFFISLIEMLIPFIL